jgi:hypothetical protein
MVVAHPFGVSAWSARPHVGCRGPFLPAVAMIMVVVTHVVFCAEPTEILKNAKTLKLVVCFENKFICKYIF